MVNRDMILIFSVLLVCGVIVSYLFLAGSKDTGVNSVVDKYAKYLNEKQTVKSNVAGNEQTKEKVTSKNSEIEEKKKLAEVAIKYKDKMDKAVNYLDENYKNLIGTDVLFHLYDIDDTKGYVVLYLNATSGNKSGKVIALLSKKNDTLMIGAIVPTKEIMKNLNVSLDVPTKNINETVKVVKILLLKSLNKNGSISVYKVTENNDLVTILFKININNQTGMFPVTVTEDGKYIIERAITLDLNKKIEPPKPPEPPKQKPIPKTDKPKVEVFVMSYCPFGVQMERALLPVIDLFKNKVDFEIKFVDYAMHGKKEVDENLRQYCIQKINKEEYWKYLKCFIATGNSTLCLNNISINMTKLNECINETDEKYNISYYRDNVSTYLNGYFPRFLVNENDNKKYGVQGSPTTFINGVEYVGPRSPEAIKEAICNAFKNKPEECNVNLSDKIVPYGIGAVGQGSGSCG